MAQTTLPPSAHVVIIGGGVIGASVAYHLTRLGVQEVVIVERKKLTSGTTWHAAVMFSDTACLALGHESGVAHDVAEHDRREPAHG